jgi:uridine kinase
MYVPYIIGITGGSGSGKTRFIRELAKHFSEDQVCLLSQDNFYFPRNLQPVDENQIQNFDKPESIDLDRMVSCLTMLSTGQTVELEEYTYNNPALPRKKIALFPARVILVEGIYLMHHQGIRDLIDFKIFIQAMEHIMLTRRIIRDQKERGYDLEDVLYRYQHHVMPNFRKYILPFRDSCDIIINNNSGFEHALKLMKSYIERILQETASCKEMTSFMG